MNRTILRTFVVVVVLAAGWGAIRGFRKPVQQVDLWPNVSLPRVPPATIDPPMTFEANRGQTAADVQFVSRGKDRTLFFTAKEAVLSLAQPRHQGHASDAVVEMKWTAYVTGHTGSTAFPTTANALRPVNTSAITSDGFPSEDGFLTRLNAAGSDLLYSTLLGGNAFDRGQGIALHVEAPACNTCKGRVAAYVSGVTTSEDFPTTSGVVQPQKQGASFNVNGFALKIIQ